MNQSSIKNEICATDLNNQGTRYLQKRDFRSAIACFSEALRYCRGFIRKDIKSTNSDANMTSSSSSSQITLNDLMAESGPSSRPMEGNCRRFIYHFPIEMPLPSALSKSSWSPYSDSNIHVLLSIVVLFNMALAHQLMAEKSPPSGDAGGKRCDSISQTYRQSLLRKSIRLYQLGYDMLRQDSENPITYCELLLLAITNNLARAYQSMGDIQPSERLFQHLSSLLRLFMYYGINEDHPMTFDCFFANSAHVEEKYNIPPTAGAA